MAPVMWLLCEQHGCGPGATWNFLLAPGCEKETPQTCRVGVLLSGTSLFFSNSVAGAKNWSTKPLHRFSNHDLFMLGAGYHKLLARYFVCPAT